MLYPVATVVLARLLYAGRLPRRPVVGVLATLARGSDSARAEDHAFLGYLDPTSQQQDVITSQTNRPFIDGVDEPWLMLLRRDR